MGLGMGMKMGKRDKQKGVKTAAWGSTSVCGSHASTNTNTSKATHTHSHTHKHTHIHKACQANGIIKIYIQAYPDYPLSMNYWKRKYRQRRQLANGGEKTKGKEAAGVAFIMATTHNNYSNNNNNKYNKNNHNTTKVA